MDVAPVVTINVSSPLTLTQFALVMNPEDKVSFLKENIRIETESWWKLAANAGIEAHMSLIPQMLDNHSLRYCKQLTNGFVQCRIEAVLCVGGSGGVAVANRLELVISPKSKCGNFTIKMQVEGSVLVREIRGILDQYEKVLLIREDHSYFLTHGDDVLLDNRTPQDYGIKNGDEIDLVDQLD